MGSHGSLPQSCNSFAASAKSFHYFSASACANTPFTWLRNLSILEGWTVIGQVLFLRASFKLTIIELGS